ncbi:MAG TPA: PEGA domain-containing protein [Bacteroidota bacterium]|nr:PEGA domain-containing protein [Bacteroidota bacterium]
MSTKPLQTLLFLYCLTVPGCATILKGSLERVDFGSDPSAAQVSINGYTVGTTPLQLQLESQKTYFIEFAKPGYRTKTVVLNGSVAGGWVILDILFGVLPLAVDAATGSWYNLETNTVYAVLESQQGESKAEVLTDSLNIQHTEPLPSHFELTLTSEEVKMILGGKVALTFVHRPFWTSKLAVGGASGIGKNLANLTPATSIEVSKDEIFYLQIEPGILYRVEVSQQVSRRITLQFFRM